MRQLKRNSTQSISNFPQNQKFGYLFLFLFISMLGLFSCEKEPLNDPRQNLELKELIVPLAPGVNSWTHHTLNNPDKNVVFGDSTFHATDDKIYEMNKSELIER